jgi:hypothetical protein
MSTDQRLLEDYIPIEAISKEARREKSIRKGHISTLHLWWPPGWRFMAPRHGGPKAQRCRRTAVRMTMRLTRSHLYAATNALANLAQEAGSIRVTVEATNPKGFDPIWLRNAVEEPLDEADVGWAG